MTLNNFHDSFISDFAFFGDNVVEYNLSALPANELSSQPAKRSRL